VGQISDAVIGYLRIHLLFVCLVALPGATQQRVAKTYVNEETTSNLRQPYSEAGYTREEESSFRQANRVDGLA
jgi:hypothetical protein